MFYFMLNILAIIPYLKKEIDRVIDLLIKTIAPNIIMFRSLPIHAGLYKNERNYRLAAV